MLSKELLQEFLHMGAGWEAAGLHYCKESANLIITVKETKALWSHQSCPYCHGRSVHAAGHAKKRRWRHLDAFDVKSVIECALPNGKCSNCGRVFQVKAGWEGRSRHYTKSFEAFALSLVKETTVKNASRVLSETDQRLWRMLFSYMEKAQGELSTVAISILHREWKRTGK
jgi:transposase